MQVGTLVKSYLKQGQVMQLATCENDRPWVCTVYFVPDEELNLYWFSWPSRRHSLELEKNKNAAITTVIKSDRPDIGVGAEGTVEVVDNLDVIKKILPSYIKKYNSGRDFLKLFKEDKNQHFVYKFKPTKFVLVDEVNFPGEGSIDWIPVNEG